MRLVRELVRDHLITGLRLERDADCTHNLGYGILKNDPNGRRVHVARSDQESVVEVRSCLLL